MKFEFEDGLVKLHFMIANPLDLFGLNHNIDNKATVLICITGLLDLYLEIAYCYLTNETLSNLRCVALLHHQKRFLFFDKSIC